MKSKITHIAVIGGGSWATAIIKILSENNVKIRWWLRNQADLEHIRTFHHNPRYLSGVQLDSKKVEAVSSLSAAIQDAEYVILAVPAAFLSEALATIQLPDLQGKRIVSAIKGMVPIENLLVTDWLEKHYQVSPSNLSAIAGPCHAEEVSLEKQSYLTIASPNLAHASDFARLMTCRYVVANPISDLYGVEYCAVMKNIMALACGICHGLGYGDNFQAVLVSNAVLEIKRFLEVVYPYYRDLDGSAYLGDLLVTCYSQFSRNRTFGNMIGRGYSVKSAQVEMNMVAEGYYAVRCIHEINHTFEENMPITRATYNILYEGHAAAEEMNLLKSLLK